jgi:hypothetical protein
VILALAGLFQLDPTGDWRAQARRIYDIVLGGLQARACRPGDRPHAW